MTTFNQIKSKIHNLNYFDCQKPQHQRQQLSLVCLNRQCQQNRIICCHCEMQSHSQHLVIPFKDYLFHIYEEKSFAHLQNPLQTPDNSLSQITLTTFNNQNNKPNYLFYIQSIQNNKLLTIKQLHTIKQKFFNQISQLQTQIQINASKYIQKIKLLSQIYYDKTDLINKINNLFNQPKKISDLIDTYVQNLIPPLKQKNITSNQFINSSQNSQYRKQTVKNQFQKIYQSFNNKNLNLQKALNKFDFNFIPKLNKNIVYQHIKYSAPLSKYDWSQTFKGQNFQIDQINNKIIRIKNNSGIGQRFALMGIGFPYNSKYKCTWAIKINKLVGWIGLGLALKNVVLKIQYKFNYTNLGHGSYLLSGNGYTWSHSFLQNNSKCQAFSFLTGDTIILQYNPNERQLTFIKWNGSVNSKFTLKIAQYPIDQQLCPCVNMCSKNDEVQIVAIPEQFN